MSFETRAYAGLTLAAFLFGITFVVVKDAVVSVPPVAFVAWRFALGGAALSLLGLPRGRGLWRDGTFAGIALFLGFALQTGGLTLTGASNSALITGLYVVITPLIVAATRRRPPHPWVVIGSVIGFIGIGLLTVREGLTLGPGDTLTLGCAVAFAAHIAILGTTAGRHPIVPFTAVQMLVTSALAFGASLVLEGPFSPRGGEWAAILATGLIVSTAAFLLQVWSQTVVGPGRAAMVLSLEPAFGVATAAIILGERLTVAGAVGALLILVAIYLVVTRERATELEAEAITAAH